MERTVKIPGPDHPITVQPSPAHVVVKAGGRVIADTSKALSLREASYGEVLYLPRDDADMSQLTRTSHETYCPYKGVCSYYSITSLGVKASTPFGPTSNPTMPSPELRTISRSIPTVSIPSKSRALKTQLSDDFARARSSAVKSSSQPKAKRQFCQ